MGRYGLAPCEGCGGEGLSPSFYWRDGCLVLGSSLGCGIVALLCAVISWFLGLFAFVCRGYPLFEGGSVRLRGEVSQPRPESWLQLIQGGVGWGLVWELWGCREAHRRGVVFIMTP